MDDRTTLPDPVAGTLPSWGDAPTSRAPGWVYIDESVYREELERFFYRGHWCYVGLECEVPDAGDFKRIKVGERSVIKVRDTDGAVRVVEYRCAHRGVAFCRERARQRQGLHLPLPPVNYSLKGDLVGLPFRRGVQQDCQVFGGMPADFKLSEHGLTQLQVGASAPRSCTTSMDSFSVSSVFAAEKFSA